MATPHEPKIETLEKIIGHTFSLKHLIRLARTSAGANPDNYDGNRKLSQLGASLVDSVLAIIVFFIGGSRGKKNCGAWSLKLLDKLIVL